MPLTPSQKSAAFRQRRAEKMARMEADIPMLREALGLALGYLIQHEPGDSRAVSNEFVAMAAVEAGLANDCDMAVIRQARQALNPGKEMGE